MFLSVLEAKIYHSALANEYKLENRPYVKPSYGVFVGELYRICKSSSVVTEFIHDVNPVKLLISKLITQNFARKVLHRFLKLFINNQLSPTPPGLLT